MPKPRKTKNISKNKTKMKRVAKARSTKTKNGAKKLAPKAG